MIRYLTKAPLDNAALNDLYRAAWPKHSPFDFEPVFDRALTHVSAYADTRLIGSVYAAWDGCQHAFLLEPTVHPQHRRQGVGRELVRRAVDDCRAAGCEWVHVDYEPHLAPFYAACGFKTTHAGLIRLNA